MRLYIPPIIWLPGLTWKPIVLAVALFLGACAALTPVQTVMATCATADATLRALTVQKAQGKLTEAQIARINSAVLVIDPICGAETPPETDLALDTIERQLLIMQGVKGVQ